MWNDVVEFELNTNCLNHPPSHNEGRAAALPGGRGVWDETRPILDSRLKVGERGSRLHRE